MTAIELEKTNPASASAHMDAYIAKLNDKKDCADDLDCKDKHDESTSKVVSKLKECGHCKKVETEPNKFQVCSRCHLATFCSHECFKSAWKSHKSICKSTEKK